MHCSQTLPVKVLWCVIVCLGFIGAGVLIGKSYKKWQDSPIATSITTHPIEDLDFPVVTVCPPKDSNTALYHDLVKAGNGNLTEETRKTLNETAFKVFLVKPHEEHIERMMAASNIRNIDQVYQGFHSLPKPYKSPNGYEIKMWNKNGTITTPWYGESYVKEYYKEDRDIHLILELPEDIKDQVGSGSLIIELEVATREQEGWEEQVKYTKHRQGYVLSELGHAYKLHKTGKN